MSWIVACGLKREARLIGRGGAVRIVAGGGDAARLAAVLDDMAEMFPSVILSSGIAGALDPALKPGDVVLDGEPAVVSRLRTILPGAIPGAVIGRDAMTPTSAGKRALRAQTGAAAIDMETHVAARIAMGRGLPFAALRVISDGADEDLPPAAQAGMKPDGGVALGAVLASLARNPAQLPALIRTGRHAGQAFRVLGRVYDALGRSGVLGLDPVEFALDVG